MSKMNKIQIDLDREDYFRDIWPFLLIGIQLSEKDAICKKFLRTIDRGLTNEQSHIFNNCNVYHQMCALWIFKECIILRISWSLN